MWRPRPRRQPWPKRFRHGAPGAWRTLLVRAERPSEHRKNAFQAASDPDRIAGVQFPGGKRGQAMHRSHNPLPAAAPAPPVIAPPIIATPPPVLSAPSRRTHGSRTKVGFLRSSGFRAPRPACWSRRFSSRCWAPMASSPRRALRLRLSRSSPAAMAPRPALPFPLARLKPPGDRSPPPASIPSRLTCRIFSQRILKVPLGSRLLRRSSCRLDP